MKTSFLCSLTLAALVCGAPEARSSDPFGDPDCSGRDPFGPSSAWSDPFKSSEEVDLDAFGRERQAPTRCEIEIFETDGAFRKKLTPDAIIEFDPQTGEGKVYPTNNFGTKDIFKPAIGVAEKSHFSDEIVIRKTTPSGLIDYNAKTSIVIENVGDLNCPKSGFSSGKRAEVYEANAAGYRSLFTAPFAEAEIECE